MTYTEQHILTRIYRDSEVFQLMESIDFLIQWDHLYKQTGGFSVLQSKGFIKSYYELYHETLEPILCIAYRGQKPIGMMCLAWHRTENYLSHAGEFEAEYHGWLVIPGFEVDFLQQSLQQLQKQFPMAKWEWLWMPPNTDIQLLESALSGDMSMALNIQEAPNWDLRKPEKLQKLRKSKSLKSKMKRFQRKGKVEFEVIEDATRLKEVLQQAKGQYDFRQQGAYGISPFADDPRKEALTLELFEQGVAHASVLWLDDKVLAFHFGCADDKRVCLGIISYDPSESKLSPGTLIIIELADRLTQDGYHYFDLTPAGGDSYKDRFANDYQTLYQPTISFTKTREWPEKIKRKGINAFKKFMVLAGIKLATLRNIKNNLQEFPENFAIKRKNYSPFLLLKNLFYKKQQIRIYTINKPSEELKPLTSIESQQFEHLMAYKDYHPFLQNRKLYQNALGKFGRGGTLFSSFKEGTMQWFGWQLDTKKPILLNACPKPIQLESGNQVFCDFYQNSNNTDSTVFAENIDEVLNAHQVTNNQKTFLILRENQQLSASIVDKWDIQLTETKTWIRLFYFITFTV